MKLFFVDGDDAWGIRSQQPVHELPLLAIHFRQFGLEPNAALITAAGALFDGLADHVVQHGDDRLRRTQVVEQRLELAFDRLLAVGLAVVLAGFGLAEVIGILSIAALRPSGGHRALAASAGHEAPQREIIAHVLAHERPFRLAQPLQYALVRFETDERLVLTLQDADTPIGCRDVAGVNGAFQNLANALQVHRLAALVDGARMEIQEALDLHLRSEASRGKALQDFTNDGGMRLVRHEHLASGG